MRELHEAIMKGKYALVRKLANELRNMGADLSGEIAFAERLSQINPGTYEKVLAALY